ncbi:glycosyltransferase [Alteromonas ponticola]|uniref:Glycosyltransferase n=1 Tax=Alteromonas aquimaris TaxID=2998417 RepID=A0ABT3P4E0_9ALTE|nr:glycosyltransferase family 2 protein [Alteromonas aquimaris]MCW8107613.1 glycosyltransferase [Alteromonas aquimaris]
MMEYEQKRLMVCWENELEKALAYREELHLTHILIFDKNGNSSLANYDVPSLTLCNADLTRFSHREPVLKAHSNLMMWLYNEKSFSDVYCTRKNGLAYLLLKCKQVSSRLDDTHLHLWGEPSAQQRLEEYNTYASRDELLQLFLERNQELVSADVACDEQNTEQKVSLIIPCFNRTQFLSQTLHSISRQTYKNYDVVIIDDGSSVEAQQKIKSIIETFQNLTIKFVVNRKSVGASKARNLGVDATDAPLIMFVDDDDVLHPEAVTNLVSAMHRTQSDFVTTSFCYFEGNTYPSFSQTEATLIHFHSDQNWLAALTYNCVGGITTLFKRSVFCKAGGFVSTQHAGEEDWQLILKLSISGAKSATFPYPMLWYRNTPSSLSKRVNTYHSRKHLFALYKQVLPKQLHHLPEYVSHLHEEKAQQSIEAALFKLGLKLAGNNQQPIYVYGAGKLGNKVLSVLSHSELFDRVMGVIDINAAKVRVEFNIPVRTLSETHIDKDAVVIIASLKFVDEIIAALSTFNVTILRLD